MAFFTPPKTHCRKNIQSLLILFLCFPENYLVPRMAEGTPSPCPLLTRLCVGTGHHVAGQWAMAGGWWLVLVAGAGGCGHVDTIAKN